MVGREGVMFSVVFKKTVSGFVLAVLALTGAGVLAVGVAHWWAPVADAQAPSGIPPAQQPGTKPGLAPNGGCSMWRLVPSPNVTGDQNILYGTDAVSGSDAWAVGMDYNSG